MLKVRSAPRLLWLTLIGSALLCAPLFSPLAGTTLPYGSFAAERQMVLEQLPCKWISMNGQDGIRREDSRYDFLCKGGVWATVSLMMDQSLLKADGIARVRLLFREWPADVHPGGGEAYVAQEFLQYALAHFVPSNLSKPVMEGFWKKKPQTWRAKGVTITFNVDDMGNHIVRRLEIDGNVGAVAAALATQAPQPAGMLNPELVTPIMVSVPEVPSPSLPPVAPAKAAAGWQTVPAPALVSDSTPPVFAAEPAPESMVKQVPPPAVSATLVPTALDRTMGRAPAPTNFDAYNKAEQLTRPFELKALEDPNANPKVVPATPQESAQETGLKKAPEPSSAQPPALTPVPTPALGTPTSGGLLDPTTATPAEAQADAPVAAPAIDPRFTPERGMPQLRYIPRAKPVEQADEVIKFEDEKSGL